MSLRKLFFLFVAVCASPASADTIHVVSHLSGYKCMMLNITAQQAMDPSFHVRVIRSRRSRRRSWGMPRFRSRFASQRTS